MGFLFKLMGFLFRLMGFLFRLMAFLFWGGRSLVCCVATFAADIRECYDEKPIGFVGG